MHAPHCYFCTSSRVLARRVRLSCGLGPQRELDEVPVTLRATAFSASRMHYKYCEHSTYIERNTLVCSLSDAGTVIKSEGFDTGSINPSHLLGKILS